MSEKQIFSALMNFDEDVWKFIVLKVIEPVLLNSFNTSMIHDALMEREDIVSKIYVRLIVEKKLENFSGSGPLIAYIGTTARNLISEELKRYQRKCRGHKEGKKVDHKNTEKNIDNENTEKNIDNENTEKNIDNENNKKSPADFAVQV